MPEDIREKVRRLIERAVHPSTYENEARNAAMAACKLIQEHKLLKEAPPPSRVPPFARAAPDMQAALDDLFGQGFSQVFRTQRAQQQARAHARPVRPPPEHTVEGEGSRKIPKDPRARPFILGSPAVCAYCIEEIPIRTMVIVSGRLVYHARCYEEATT
jgi:hypothetical protein